jgi:hypothetical protein
MSMSLISKSAIVSLSADGWYSRLWNPTGGGLVGSSDFNDRRYLPEMKEDTAFDGLRRVSRKREYN